MIWVRWRTKITGPDREGCGLDFFALEGNEAHGRALGDLADRLRIGHVILLALDERLHVRRRDQLHRVAELGDLTPPVVGARTGSVRGRATAPGRRGLDWI